MKSDKDNKVIWQSVSGDKNTAATGFFQTLAAASEGNDRIIVTGLNEGRYKIKNRPQRLYIERFGGLMKHVLPVALNPDGMVMQIANRHYSLTDCIEEYTCSTKALRSGIPLPSQFLGTGYNENVRMLGDFGSNIYISERINEGGTQNDQHKIQPL
jgi:alpha-galactosidase